MSNRRPAHLLDVPPDLEFGGQDGAEPDFSFFKLYPGAEHVETMWGIEYDSVDAEEELPAVERTAPPIPGYWWGVKVWLRPVT